jgi:hypothetical protein
VALASDICAKILSVSLERASWIAVVVICVITAAILGIKGYVGYPIVAGAVGAAAAVNLF